MTSDTAPIGAPAPADGAAPNPFWSVMLPVLSFVGTGIGIIGFVIFFGGFVVWARFDAAGLPANEAVAQLPRSNLVVTGASFLIPALVTALAAVAVAVVLWDAVIGNRRRRRIAEAEDRHRAQLTNLEIVKARARRVEQELDRLSSTLKQHDAAAKEAHPDSSERKAFRERYDETDIACRNLAEELATLQESTIPESERLERETGAARADAAKADRREHLLLIAVGGIPMLVAQLIIIFASWSVLDWGQRGLLFAVLGATLAVSIVVVTLVQRFTFAWFSLCVFLGVAVLIAFAAYERAHSDSRVSPVAAVDGASPVTGFFVAETSDAVYVAQPGVRVNDKKLTLDRSKITLVRVGKKTLTGLTIGALMNEAGAYRRSVEIALSLCQREKATTEPSAARSTSKKRGARKPELKCSSKDISALRNTLAAV